MKLTQPLEERPQAVGPPSFLSWEGASGTKKTESAGKRGVLVTAVEMEQKGRRFKCEEHWVGKLLPLAPSQQEPLPCVPSASLQSSTQMSFSWLEDGQSKCWGQQLVFCQRFALPVSDTSPDSCTLCLVIVLWFCLKQIPQPKTWWWLKFPAWTRES